jgi:hypothetical protein
MQRRGVGEASSSVSLSRGSSQCACRASRGSGGVGGGAFCRNCGGVLAEEKGGTAVTEGNNIIVDV